jgi:hypothetical protein
MNIGTQKLNCVGLEAVGVGEEGKKDETKEEGEMSVET